MIIRLTTDVPFHCSPRRLSYMEKAEVQKNIDSLLREGVIQPSDSPYASAIVLVKKKNGQTRMCIDYRGLNKITVRDNYPLPLIEDCLEYLEGKKFFTILDLKSGFHQVKVHEDSIKYTAFVTPSGQYEYRRMPFGLKNAPSVFQRFINNIFRDLIDKKMIVIYMDDILLATKTLDEHKQLLKTILDRITSKMLKLNLNKCRFGCDQIEYLGYSVSMSGICPSDSHLTAIKEYPLPTTAKAVHSCLGLFSYFRRFVPQFSRIAKPLQDLLHKDAIFHFDHRCHEAFQELKSRLVKAPVLAIYSDKKVTELHTDASSLGFGAALMQKQEDGKFHPVAYFSKTTTAVESRYHSFELETLAIIYALKRFHVYLGIPFKIITDCNSLTQTLEKKLINPRIARWALELENYQYTIQHRGGCSMGHVDALSRCHETRKLDAQLVAACDQVHTQTDFGIEDGFDLCRLVAMVDANDVDLNLQVTQNRDPVIVEIRNRLENEKEQTSNYEMKDGLIFYKTKNDIKLLYVPAEMENNVIRLIHEKIGHQSVDKSCDQIKMHYWFPKLRTKVEAFIKSCVKCLMYAAPVRATERNFYSIPKKPIPFDTVHLDHFGPLPSLISKRKHLLIVIDAFTKYVKLYPVNSTSTKEVNASLDKYFEYYGRPKRVITDRGSCFRSLEITEYLQEHNIDHVKVAVASPQANGQVERVNRVIKPMLGKLSEPISHADWSLKLRQVEYALNNSIHSTTQRTPSELLFGVSQRGVVIDELTEYLENKTERFPDLAEIRNEASKAIERSQKYSTDRAKLRNKPAKEYEIGDYVVMLNVDTKVGKNKKFIPKYRGPYVVHKKLGHDRYVIKDIENCQLTQLPYNSVVEANRIRKWVSPLGPSEVNRTVEKCNTGAPDSDEEEEDTSTLVGEEEEESTDEDGFAGFDAADIAVVDRGQSSVRLAEL